jgi:hypothetical protein
MAFLQGQFAGFFSFFMVKQNYSFRSSPKLRINSFAPSIFEEDEAMVAVEEKWTVDQDQMDGFSVKWLKQLF